MTGRSEPWSLVLVGGTTYPDRLATAPHKIDGQLRAHTDATIIDNGGYSDIEDDAVSAATLLTRHQTYVAARKAAGCSRYVASTLPDNTTLSAPEKVVMEDFNDLLRAADHYDDLVDLAAVPELSDASNTTYFSDGLHFTAAGAAIAADAITAVLDA